MSKFTTPVVEELYLVTLDGWCEESGTVEAPCGWFALVEDHNGPEAESEGVDGCDWIVREDSFGFVDVEGPFDHIDIDRDGYHQPARRRFEELCAEYSEWLGDEDGED